MLNTLIESRAVRARSLQAQSTSLGVHALLIAGALYATQRAVGPVVPPEVFSPPVYVPVDQPPPPPATPSIVAPVLKGFRLVPAIVKIPSVLPEIDLTQSLTNPDDYYRPVGVAGGDPKGTQTAPVGDTYSVEQVDKPAYLLPNSARPAYPDGLRSAGLAGEVNAQFVIDTTGRAEMAGLTIVSSTHQKFTDAVKAALAKARFAPAEVNGRKVKQIVRMPFVFSLQK